MCVCVCVCVSVCVSVCVLCGLLYLSASRCERLPCADLSVGEGDRGQRLLRPQPNCQRHTASVDPALYLTKTSQLTSTLSSLVLLSHTHTHTHTHIHIHTAHTQDSTRVQAHTLIFLCLSLLSIVSLSLRPLLRSAKLLPPSQSGRRNDGRRADGLRRLAALAAWHQWRRFCDNLPRLRRRLRPPPRPQGVCVGLACVSL